MKDRAIFVMAYNRTRYLEVAVESIRRCRGVEAWDVIIDRDGGRRFRHALTKTEPYEVIRRPENLGNRQHATEILRTAYERGYKFILLMEDDMLLRSDALLRLWELRKLTGLTSTYSIGPYLSAEVCFVSNGANLISHPLIKSLIKFMDAKEYLGLPNVGNANKPIESEDHNHPCYDVCWFAWAKKNEVQTVCFSEQLCLNFGHVGMHFYRADFNQLALTDNNSEIFKSILETCRLLQFESVSRTPGFHYQ